MSSRRSDGFWSSVDSNSGRHCSSRESKLTSVIVSLLTSYQYNTKLCKKSPNRLCNPEASSVTFDREGKSISFLRYLRTSHLAPRRKTSRYNACMCPDLRLSSLDIVTLQHHYPTIYGLADPHPLAVCSGKYLPDGTPVTSSKDGTYANSCSIKVDAFHAFSRLRLIVI